MRILHFYKTYYPDTFGGVEQVIYQLCRGVTKLGIKASVLSLSHKAVNHTINLDGHEVHQVKTNFQIASTGFSASSFRQFARLAKEADIVHYHYPWPFMDLVHFATRLKKPTVVTYHSDIIRQKNLLKLYRPLKHRFLGSVDRIVATSPNYAETSHVLDRYKAKTVIIPYGLDKATYPKASEDLLLKWKSKLGERFFLFVGMLRYYKGLHILIDALQGQDYPVAIMGAGPLEIELKEQATKLGLKNIHFLGALPDEDKVALLELSYAIVFPSHIRSEAFGISLLEGAMFGKAMISSEIGTGTSYININGKTGLVVPPGNPEVLREAMRYLWNNPESTFEMGKCAEQRYWSLFTAERMATSYQKLYSELLADKVKVTSKES